MKNVISIALLSLSTSLFTYGYAAESHLSHEAHSHQGSETTTHGLDLNNGERWEMDNHTRILSQQMEQTFFGADHSTRVGLNAAGAELETQVNELIAGCTMEGMAHEQLHLFLNDQIPAINTLAKAEDYETARASAIKLKAQFENYRKHFK